MHFMAENFQFILMEKFESDPDEDPKTTEIVWQLRIEPLSEMPKRPARPEFSKTEIPKCVVSPPWQKSQREVPKFVKGEKSPATEVAATTPKNDEILRQRKLLYCKKISALMKRGRLPVTEIGSPVKQVKHCEHSSRKDGPLRRKQSIRLGGGESKMTPCGSSTQSTNTLKYSNRKIHKFEDSVTESLSPSSKKTRSKRPSILSSASRSQPSSRSSSTSVSSTGSTWDPESSRDSTSLSSVSSDFSLIDASKDAEKSDSSSRISRVNRGRNWHRQHYPLSLRLPEGTTSNISANSCDSSKKTNSSKSRRGKSVDLSVSWKQSVSGSHVLASAYEPDVSKKGSIRGLDDENSSSSSSSSSYSSKRSPTTSSSSEFGSNFFTLQKALLPRKAKKACKSPMSPPKNSAIAVHLPLTKEMRKNSAVAEYHSVAETLQQNSDITVYRPLCNEKQRRKPRNVKKTAVLVAKVLSPSKSKKSCESLQNSAVAEYHPVVETLRQNSDIAVYRPLRIEKQRRKSKNARKTAAVAARKKTLRKISPRIIGNALDSVAMPKKAAHCPQPEDWSSNLMAIRQLECLALARAERERFNFTEYVAWILLVVFICFVLLYRSEIERA